MLGLIIQVTLVSIIFIFLVHHLISFLRETLTVPKIRDLVNKPNEKYTNIFKTINNDNSITTIDDLNLFEDFSNNKNDNIMKNELKSFLKKQLNSNNNDSNSNSTIYSSNELSNAYSTLL